MPPNRQRCITESIAPITVSFRSPQRVESRSPPRIEFRSPQRVESGSPQPAEFRIRQIGRNLWGT
jgi:hypothetical protein